jgi:DNA-binding NtrC family response regulator
MAARDVTWVAGLAQRTVCGEISGAPPDTRFEKRTVTETILVVDDEPSIRRFAARALLEEGFRVREAVDGLQALEIVKAGGVSALVSDVVMPRLNGVQLMETLARSHPRLPIVLMSGYAVRELEGMGIAAPCALIAKPFSVERLVEEVRRCLSGGDPAPVAGKTRG